MSLKEKLSYLIFILLILFVLYCAVWSAYTVYRYEPFRAGFGAVASTTEEDGYVYGVFKHSFPAWTGNLTVGSRQAVDKNKPEEVGVDLCIWPRGFHDYEVMARFWELVPDESGTLQTMVRYCVMLDEQMNLTDSPDNTPEGRKLYEENKDKIEKLYRLANERWGILDVK